MVLTRNWSGTSLFSGSEAKARAPLPPSSSQISHLVTWSLEEGGGPEGHTQESGESCIALPQNNTKWMMNKQPINSEFTVNTY